MESRKNYKIPEVHGVEKEVKKPIDVEVKTPIAVEVSGNSEKMDNVSSFKNKHRNRGQTEQKERSLASSSRSVDFLDLSSKSESSPESSPRLDYSLRSDLDNSMDETLLRSEEYEKILDLKEDRKRRKINKW
ncbi:hypothetical protein CDAR_192611 [Caerostris darwini]|uniref:Uncharacterized protein n=1 Tax=Caerostris darwini TaxID=1538125 RepID=A0AAV4W6T9_9ARAC|nr:hypothetical protein CDAR_192611 [Caerostris darwini]